MPRIPAGRRRIHQLSHRSHPATCDSVGGAYHACTQILGNGILSEKIYYAAAQGSLVLPSEYQETDNNSATVLLQKNFTWAQNSAGNYFVGTLASTLNPGGSSAATTSTVQTVDAYGNLTRQQVYDYGSSTVSRQYDLSYVTDSNYIGRYIRNRLGTAAVTANNVTTTLAINGYDGAGLGPLQVQGLRRESRQPAAARFRLRRDLQLPRQRDRLFANGNDGHLRL